MSGAIPPLPQYAFMAWCSGKKRSRMLVVCLNIIGIVTIPGFLFEVRVSKNFVSVIREVYNANGLLA
jgi:hypothetical protein